MIVWMGVSKPYLSKQTRNTRNQWKTIQSTQSAPRPMRLELRSGKGMKDSKSLMQLESLWGFRVLYGKKYLLIRAKNVACGGTFLTIIIIICNIKAEFQPRCFPRNFEKFLQPATLLSSRPWHRCFPLNFAQFLTTFILRNISKFLFLMMSSSLNSFARFIVH